MKKIIAILFFGTLFLGVACKKDYFHDTGVQKGIYDGSSLEFIHSRPDLFDSLSKVIKLAGMEEFIDKNPNSFFAAPDYTIQRSVKALNKFLYDNGKDTVARLEQIHPDIWKSYLSLYIFNKVLFLKDVPQIDTLNMNVYPGQGFATVANQNMNLGVLYNDVKSSGSGGSQVVKYAGYRQLYISYINNISDLQALGAMINAPVATSNIKTNNGVVHVLNLNKHNFGFDTFKFISSVYSKGLVN